MIVDFKLGVLFSILADMDEVGKRFMVARGGSGGGPENGFVCSKGEAKSVRIDLKLLADVGLVG